MKEQIQIRNFQDYDEAIQEILSTLDTMQLNIVEAAGVLDYAKEWLLVNHINQQEKL